MMDKEEGKTYTFCVARFDAESDHPDGDKDPEALAKLEDKDKWFFFAYERGSWYVLCSVKEQHQALQILQILFSRLILTATRNENFSG